ncbi:MAG: hypothetical protein SPK95_08885 [Veillonella caviae]|uniref:hypothetical protein n=1 Tax=Veillonella caviae TaxID=248316 RepID=UPI002A90C114|nr:hypothetical protein [Veillonella caviae]MDY5716034.1 hypothetical protein [Veillonella caviae]
MNEVMTVKEASELSGLTEQAIRCGLKAGKLPFGFAFKSDNSMLVIQNYEEAI